MFAVPSLAAQGALVGYGVQYREFGRLSAKYVQRVLAGTSPQNLPVESLSKVELVVNLKTAQEIGVTIPQSVLLRADEVTTIAIPPTRQPGSCAAAPAPRAGQMFSNRPDANH
jgi:ABC-type uncharacterized transport system substrate-binding protein